MTLNWKIGVDDFIKNWWLESRMDGAPKLKESGFMMNQCHVKCNNTKIFWTFQGFKPRGWDITDLKLLNSQHIPIPHYTSIPGSDFGKKKKKKKKKKNIYCYISQSGNEGPKKV